MRFYRFRNIEYLYVCKKNVMICIEGMEFYAYHGHFKEERIVGNRFVIDCYIDVDSTKAGVSDNLNDAINYVKIYDIIKDEMNIKSHLLEHIATRIIDSIYQHFQQIDVVKIKISKMNPPLGGKVDKVSVILSKKRACNQ